MKYALILILIPFMSEAKDFTVYKTINGCKYFIAEQGFDYILAEEWMCSRPTKSDSGFGELNSYGFKDVILDGVKCTLYIDNYMMLRSSALERLAEKCGE